MHFLELELIEGESLDRILPPGDLQLDQIFELAIPIADALTAAHAKGITHPDLKPANVMVTTDRRPKILDFGLAKLTEKGNAKGETEETESLTQPGMVLGTIPYMSPEQLQGKENLNHSQISFPSASCCSYVPRPLAQALASVPP